MRRRRGPLWRRLLSWAFLLLFCLAAPLALVTGWARASVVDPAVYTATVRNVAAEPRVQAGLTQAVAARTEELLSGENPTATEAVQARVMAQAVGEEMGDIVASDAFRDVWETANRNAHRLLFAGSADAWGRPVILDLSPLLGQIQAEMATLAVQVPAGERIDAADLQIPVLDAAAADRIRRAAQQLDVNFWASLAAAVFSFILSVSLATDRLAAVGRIGFGLAIAMVALIAAMLATQQGMASAAPDNGARVTLTAVIEAVTQGLRLAAVGLALAGLLLGGIFTGLCALRG
jgi:hypothetical protein